MSITCSFLKRHENSWRSPIELKAELTTFLPVGVIAPALLINPCYTFNVFNSKLPPNNTIPDATGLGTVNVSPVSMSVTRIKGLPKNLSRPKNELFATIIISSFNL
jgi:hypothetical protein